MRGSINGLRVILPMLTCCTHESLQMLKGFSICSAFADNSGIRRALFRRDYCVAGSTRSGKVFTNYQPGFSGELSRVSPFHNESEGGDYSSAFFYFCNVSA